MEDDLNNTLGSEDRKPLRGASRSLPHLYVVFSCDDPRAVTSRHSLGNVDTVLIGGRGVEFGWARNTKEAPRTLVLRFPDRRISKSHVRILRKHDHWILEDAQSKNGTVVNGAPTTRAALADGDLIEAGHTFFLFRSAVDVTLDDLDDVTAPATPPALGLSTLSPSLGRMFELLMAAARSKEAMVLFGASGTGKEVIARAIHRLSARNGEFTAVNCGAIPDTLVESELFGVKRGAHSEAKEDRIGLVRSAEGGTLFLDEIADLPLLSQVKFLRVLQEREVTPLSATRPVKVDVRLVAATHQDLKTAVEKGRFRSDLYSRLSGFAFTLPELCKRREDFGLIVAALLRNVEGADKIRFTTDAVRALLRYHWPMNIRELDKTVRTAWVWAAARGEPIEVEDLPLEVQAVLAPAEEPEEPEERNTPEPAWSEKDRLKREQIIELLTLHQGNISAVARDMGKARMQVQRDIKRLRIDVSQFRAPSQR